MIHLRFYLGYKEIQFVSVPDFTKENYLPLSFIQLFPMLTTLLTCLLRQI